MLNLTYKDYEVNEKVLKSLDYLDQYKKFKCFPLKQTVGLPILIQHCINNGEYFILPFFLFILHNINITNEVFYVDKNY